MLLLADVRTQMSDLCSEEAKEGQWNIGGADSQAASQRRILVLLQATKHFNRQIHDLVVYTTLRKKLNLMARGE